jgi:hypothetical protein
MDVEKDMSDNTLLPCCPAALRIPVSGGGESDVAQLKE